MPLRSVTITSTSTGAPLSVASAVCLALWQWTWRDQFPRLCQFKHFLRSVGIQNPLSHTRIETKFFRFIGQKSHADLAAARMKIERALRQFCQLGKAASNCQPVDWMYAQIFQQTRRQNHPCRAARSPEIVDGLRCILGSGASRGKDMRQSRARDTSMPRWIEWIQAAQEKG